LSFAKRKRKQKRACGPARRSRKRRKELAGLKKQRGKLARCKTKPKPRPYRAPAAAAPATPAPAAPEPATGIDPDLVPPHPGTLDTPLPKYSGPFGRREATRLLWRAGFGPWPGQAEALASAGLDAAVAALTRPAPAVMTGPEPVTETGGPIGQFTGNRHHQLWWFDRMIRSSQSLVERMTLNWHDWFATSGDIVLYVKSMVGQNELFRRHALGGFDALLLEVTRDPAMLFWLDGVKNYKGHVNENYARELMELFTLGEGRGAYTEPDVRELARALTGWRVDNTAEGLWYHYEPAYHDTGAKTVFGRTGPWDWQDACRLCLEHPMHPSFLVTKLWGYFLPTEPSDADRHALERLYRDGRYAVRPVVEAILTHPDFYTGPAMVTPPVVMMAGLMRALGRGIDTVGWMYIMGQAGHKPFFPPDVSGWDERRWLDTTDTQARWRAAAQALKGKEIRDSAADTYDDLEAPATAVSRALAFWGDPDLSDETLAALQRFAQTCLPTGMNAADQRRLRAQRQNALRQLIGACPDLSVS
jgi:Protein of unknown function (DUF1800)